MLVDAYPICVTAVWIPDAALLELVNVDIIKWVEYPWPFFFHAKNLHDNPLLFQIFNEAWTVFHFTKLHSSQIKTYLFL